jgi:hypothetical protein
MSARITQWGAGLALSLAAHAGAGVALMAALQPEPVREQPNPGSELEVEAYALKRDTARETEPEMQTAARAAPGETALDPGAIAQSRAEAVALPDAALLTASRARPDALAAAAAPTDSVTADTPSAKPLAAASAPTTALAASAAPVTAAQLSAAAPKPAALAVATPVSAVIASAAPPAQVSPAVAPQAAPVMAAEPGAATAFATPPPTVAARPAPLAAVTAEPLRRSGEALPVASVLATALPAAAPRPSSAASAAPDIAPATPGNPPRVAAEQATPPADRLKATLAFPGGQGGVDPVSLAAFQSFMQPGDATVSGDPLRDGVSALLAQVPCSRLQVVFDPETATLKVNGHIPEDDLRAPVLATLGAQMGADIGLSDNILVLPRPQCGALSGIANVGLPQSTDQITNPLLIGNEAQARVFGFVKDDPLSFDISGPDYPAYVYVDYFDADGNVIHLAPNDRVPLERIAAEAPYRVGTRSPDQTGLHLVIGPPYGQEITVAFAASEPLYDGLRPMIEPAAPYLEWLKARVAEARAEHPGFKGEWVYFFASTSEN